MRKLYEKNQSKMAAIRLSKDVPEYANNADKFPILLYTAGGIPVPLTVAEAIGLKWQLATAVNCVMEDAGVRHAA